MCLTPRHSNLFQGGITVLVPLVSNRIRMNPVFEVAERPTTTNGVTQVIPEVIKRRAHSCNFESDNEERRGLCYDRP